MAIDGGNGSCLVTPTAAVIIYTTSPNSPTPPPHPHMHRRGYSRREQSSGFNRLVDSTIGAPYLTTDDDAPTTPVAGPSNIQRVAEGKRSGVQRVSTQFTLILARASSQSPSTPPRNRPQLRRGSTELPRRSTSPTPSVAGFSLIESEEADDSDSYYAYRTPYKFTTWGRRGGIRSTPTLNYFSSYTLADRPSPRAIRTLLPRLWDVIVTSPTKSRSAGNSPTNSYSSPSKRGQSFGLNTEEFGAGVEYMDISPLGDEEGELIDDEACFVAVDFWGVGISSRARVVTGIGMLITPT
jgi:hypothetical protein